ncbi:ester cyclase [Kineococcus sp. SYSU DK004]|uniref:ester cyclase n=1 Tax=Kineococcus sp. SYSU DK004 TaxID=3383125 RepID=UPI003D7D2A7F
MSVDTSTGLLQEYVDALLNGGDFARFFTDDVVWTTVDTGERITGRRAVADHITTLHTRVFDARPEVRAMGAVGDHAFLEADFVGTHTGRFGDLEPAGARVRVPYCVVYDLTGSGISALRLHMSMATLVGQLQAGSGTPTG